MRPTRILVPSTTALLFALSCAALLRGDDAKHAAIGQAAPSFSLPDENGKTVSLSDYAGKIVVLEWVNPSCPYVKRHYSAKTMTTLADRYKDKDVAWIAINSTKGATAASDKDFASQNGVSYPILTDTDHAAAKAYDAKTTPQMFVIDKDAKLVYAGAIDDDPSAEGSKGAAAKNYVAQALDEVLAGKPVSTPETKPYGCGVHK
jgi:peroxiredoxin